eukprot:365923_1
MATINTSTPDIHHDCNKSFSQCSSALNLKSVVVEYNKIICDQNVSSEFEIANKINELINNKLLNGNYSNIKLINDFFHLKYDHKLNDDNNKFNSFYRFISNDEEFLLCDIQHCKGHRRYHRHRANLRNYTSKSIENNDTNMSSYNILSRVHSFFIHSYDNKLTEDEISYIEQQLNNVDEEHTEQNSNRKSMLIAELFRNKKRKSTVEMTDHCKYMTSNQESINYEKIALVLNNHGINIQQEQIEIVFDEHGYHKQQLINDICDALINNNDQDILLTKMLKYLQVDDAKSTQVYDLILHNYIKKTELDDINFVKVLMHTASNLYPDINTQQIQQFSEKENVNVNMFIKGNEEFINAAKFAKIFEKMGNWDRKKWGTIYKTIRRWTPKTCFQPEIAEQEQKQNYEAESTMINDIDSVDSNEDSDDYISDDDCKSDEDIINSFCAITRATKLNAEAFLKYANWNVDHAIDTYYALSGNVAALGADFQQYSEMTHEQEYDEEAVYNEGVQFWYWKSRNKNEEKRFIKSKYSSLKREILSKKLKLELWNNLQIECKQLIQVDKIKRITSNGKDYDIYGLQHSENITTEYLCVVKLYTDFTSLCRRFCGSFRLKKLSKNTYERVESLQNRNKKFAIWARLLIECVQCFGSLSDKKKKEKTKIF